MLSDNGTNFTGGRNEINQLVKQIEVDNVQRMTFNNGLNWHWNPPAATHFGGVFERMTRSAKQAVNCKRGLEKNKGEVALVIDTDTPRRQWTIGQIVENYQEQIYGFV